MKFYKVTIGLAEFIRPDGASYAYEELYTEQEVKSGNLNAAFMEIVDIPESDTYFYFNRRYQKRTYHAEYIDFYKCWRLYDPKYPQWTVAFADDLELEMKREDCIIIPAEYSGRLDV